MPKDNSTLASIRLPVSSFCQAMFNHSGYAMNQRICLSLLCSLSFENAFTALSFKPGIANILEENIQIRITDPFIIFFLSFFLSLFCRKPQYRGWVPKGADFCKSDCGINNSCSWRFMI